MRDPARQQADICVEDGAREQRDAAFDGYDGAYPVEPIEHGHGSMKVERDVGLAELGMLDGKTRGCLREGGPGVEELDTLRVVRCVERHALGHVAGYEDEEARSSDITPILFGVEFAQVRGAQAAGQGLDCLLRAAVRERVPAPRPYPGVNRAREREPHGLHGVVRDEARALLLCGSAGAGRRAARPCAVTPRQVGPGSGRRWIRTGP